jgi:hypothetical protein
MLAEDSRTVVTVVGHLRFNGVRPDVDGVVGSDLSIPRT